MFIFSVKDRTRLRTAIEGIIQDSKGFEKEIGLTLLALLYDLEASEAARQVLEKEVPLARKPACEDQTFDLASMEWLTGLETRYSAAREKLAGRDEKMEAVCELLMLSHQVPALVRETQRLKTLVDELMLYSSDHTALH